MIHVVYYLILASQTHDERNHYHEGGFNILS